VVSNVTVLSGGSMTVYSGGSSIDTTVADGANVDVKPGGVITYKQ
jgi:autotransporter passenger strand-loop-strand repeat protein